MQRRLTARGQQRRRQLMEYAAARFADGGYHSTSVAELVRGLGVGKGVFYWYFSSKDELFIEILKDTQQRLRRRQQQAIGDEPDPVKRIELGVRASIAWFAEHRDFLAMVQFAATDERFAEVVRRGQEVTVADTARHVKEGIVEGRIRDVDPFLLSHAIFGVTGHLARTFVHERTQVTDEVADAAVAFCLGGLLGP